MTKLIAIDLDGTLLDSCRQMPADTVKVLTGLLDRGIRIAIASGRPYMGISALFAPIKDRLIMICENGAAIFYKGVLLESKPIAVKPLMNALQKVRMIAHHYPMFCGIKASYIEDTDPEFCDTAELFYPDIHVVENLETVPDEDAVCKIAVYNTHDESATEIELLQRTVTDLRVVASSNGWLDISCKQATKGAALRFVQEHFGITADQTMAFGDYYNDIEMLQSAAESYAVANAVAEVKAEAKHMCLSNDESGVLKILKRL